MGVSHNNLSSSKTEYVRTYSDIKGVDFSCTGTPQNGRLPLIENMYRDYDAGGDGILESIPGYRRIFSLKTRVNAMFLQKISDTEEYILVHAGTKLYRFSVAERDSGKALNAIATLRNTRSSGFSFEGSFYILDGESITVVGKDGSVSKVEEGGAEPYIPTTYQNGEEYEQRNLLTDGFIEKYSPGTLSLLTYGTPTLKYMITDKTRKECAVIGIEDGFSGTLYIPESAMLADSSYEVTEIIDGAFSGNEGITALIMGDSIVRVGCQAFSDCTALTRAVISDSTEVIGKEAFSGCTSLDEVMLGRGILEIGGGAFSACPLSSVHYAREEDDLFLVTGHEELGTSITYRSRHTAVRIEVRIKTPAERISRLSIGGEDVPFSAVENGGIITSVIAELPDRHALFGKGVTVQGSLSAEGYAKSAHGTDLGEIYAAGGNSGEVIKKCTKAAVFDGRIFLSGNPDLPNTVFHSSNKRGGAVCALYFGSLDYLSDGTGGYPVISMLAAQDTLAVFKSGDDGNGSIFYHCAEKSNSAVRPVRYPVSYIHSGVCAVGDSAVFFDDPLFVSKLGICALDKNRGTLGRDIVCRSHNINPKFLSEELSDVRLTVWCGYLVCAVGTHVYLADSRQTFTHKTGGKEYEWFYLTDIGNTDTNSAVFRFHSIPYGSYKVYDKPDTIVESPKNIISLPANDYHAGAVYSIKINGVRYHIYPTEQRTGSNFSPCTDVIAANDLLFFGCANGAVCVFNNDKRGEVPERLLESDESFDIEAFKSYMGKRIHSDFYDFDDIAPRYVIKTGRDNCDVPYLSKNTTRGSLTLKYKSFAGSRLKCECETDRQMINDQGGFAGCAISFTDMHFDNFSFDTQDAMTVSARANEKNWIEKQLTVYSDEHRSPIGIYSINYRFKINGRIKKR